MVQLTNHPLQNDTGWSTHNFRAGLLSAIDGAGQVGERTMIHPATRLHAVSLYTTWAYSTRHQCTAAAAN